MMRKRTVLTILGIILSFCIAVGNWVITSKLIAAKENALLSVIGKTYVNTPATTPINTSINSEDENIVETEYVFPKLSNAEIFAVLQNWESEGYEQPHEPVNGQLNMEQAIDAGKTGLRYFCENGIIPEKLHEYEYDKINAYLYKKQPRENSTQDIEPFYSYWVVYLYGEKMNAVLTINAVTAQIWRAAIYSNIPDKNFEEKLTLQTLNTFTSYLDMKSGASFLADVDSSISMDIDGGMFFAITRIDGVEMSVTDKDEKIFSVSNVAMLNIFLSTQP